MFAGGTCSTFSFFQLCCISRLSKRKRKSELQKLMMKRNQKKMQMKKLNKWVKINDNESVNKMIARDLVWRKQNWHLVTKVMIHMISTNKKMKLHRVIHIFSNSLYPLGKYQFKVNIKHSIRISWDIVLVSWMLTLKRCLPLE